MFFSNTHGEMVNVKDYVSRGIVNNLQTYFISVHPHEVGTTVINGILLVVFLLSTVLFFVVLLCKGQIVISSLYEKRN